MKKLHREDLLKILRNKKYITQKQLYQIEQNKSVTKKNVEDIIVELGILREEKLLNALADYLGIPFVKIDPLEMNLKDITTVLPGRYAQAYGLMPIEKDDQTVTFAISDPFADYPFYEIERMIKLKIKLALSTRQNIKTALGVFYGLSDSLSAAEKDMIVRGTVSTVDLANLERLNRDLQVGQRLDSGAQPIVNAVNHLFQYAFEQRASDIHLEPKRETSIVRFRIDGVLHNVYMIKKMLYNSIVSRIKVMAGMNIAEKRRPQDGRIKMMHRNEEIELRVSTVSTAFGEKIVLRVFDPDILLQDIKKLGFSKQDYHIFDDFMHHPYGVVLVTGPTGSGKTTTLYSALNTLASPEINITTIEDPIELIHEGFNQVAINPSIDITFASVLRTMLRQDPDIIMVGEIRDSEVVESAIQAALTGHLVLSTLHTNDAPTAITRLIDLGGQPFLISSTLIGVLAQRLIRMICPHCKISYLADRAEFEKVLGISIKKNQIKLHKGEGCLECRGTGYLGRIGVFEIMKMNDRLRELTKEKAPANEIKQAALKDGMVTLSKNVLKKLVSGTTTLDEAAKIVRGI